MPRSNMSSLSCTVVAVALFSPLALAQKVLYWTDKDAPRVHRMNADGAGGPQTLLTSPTVFDPRGIVLDPASQKFYFADTITQSIRRANLDGSNVENVVTTGQSQPADMAIDTAAGHLYWSDTAAGAIRRSDLSGNNVTTIRSSLVEPYFITLDTPGGKIYWSDFNSGIIHRTNLDGTGAVEDFITGLTRVRDVAIDPSSGYIYWADRNSQRIQRRLISGGAIQNLFDANDGLLRPHGLVLDPEAGYLYWTDTDAHAVARGNLDGSGLPLYLATGSNGQVGPWSIALAVPEPGGMTILSLCAACGFAARHPRPRTA